MTNTNACKAGGALPARPEMAEARTCSGVSGFVEGQTERNGSDFASRCAGVQGVSHADAKTFATLAARAALLRCVLRRIDGGGFLITLTGWGLSRSLASLAEVSSLLDLMEGTR
jgi:hypothetical protein